MPQHLADVIFSSVVTVIVQQPESQRSSDCSNAWAGQCPDTGCVQEEQLQSPVSSHSLTMEYALSSWLSPLPAKPPKEKLAHRRAVAHEHLRKRDSFFSLTGGSWVSSCPFFQEAHLGISSLFLSLDYSALSNAPRWGLSLSRNKSVGQPHWPVTPRRAGLVCLHSYCAPSIDQPGTEVRLCRGVVRFFAPDS